MDEKQGKLIDTEGLANALAHEDFKTLYENNVDVYELVVTPVGKDVKITTGVTTPYANKFFQLVGIYQRLIKTYEIQSTGVEGEYNQGIPIQ